MAAPSMASPRSPAMRSVKELGIQGVNPKGLSGMDSPVIEHHRVSALTSEPGGQSSVKRHPQDHHRSSHMVQGPAYAEIWRRTPALQLSALTRFREGAYGNFSFTGQITGYAPADFYLGYPFSSIAPGSAYQSYPDRQGTRHVCKRHLEGESAAHARIGGYAGTGLVRRRTTTARFITGTRRPGTCSDPGGRQISPLYPVNTIKVVTGDVRTHPSNRNFQPRLGVAWRPLGRTGQFAAAMAVFTEQIGRLRPRPRHRALPVKRDLLQQHNRSDSADDQSLSRGRPVQSLRSLYPAIRWIPGTGGFTSSMRPSNGKSPDIGLRLSYQGMRAHGMNSPRNW